MTKRILLIEASADNVGGSYVSLYNLAKTLDKRKYRPHVVFYGHNPYIRLLRKCGIRVHILRHKGTTEKMGEKQLERFGKRILCVKPNEDNPSSQLYRSLAKIKRILFTSLPEAIELKSIISENKIDIIHSNGNLTWSLSSVLASVLTRKPYVLHLRQFVCIGFIEKMMIARTSSVICISKAIHYCLIKQGISKTKLKIEYNVLDVNKFRPGPSRRGKKIGIIGRLVDWKGHRVFLEAARIVLNHCSDAEFIIAGTGPEESNLKRIAKDLKVTNSVHFVGYVNNVARLLINIDLVVNCSIGPEPFGRSIIEAMAMKKPVIAATTGGATEIVQDKITGYIVPPNDPQALADKMLTLLRDELQQKKMGEAGRKVVEQNFDNKRCTEQIEGTYNKIS
ncbi:MAG: glycosyltransferase family 4 protein [archaeon]